MKPPFKVATAVLLGGAIAGGLAYFLHGRAEEGRQESGLTLEFEPVQADADLAQVRTILERRLDGYKALVGAEGGRIRVWIPYPEERQVARERLLQELENLRKAEASPAKVDAILLLGGEVRVAEMRRVAPDGSAQHDALQKLADATDAVSAARRMASTRPADSPAALQTVAEAQDGLRRARIEFFKDALTGESIERALAAADIPGNVAGVKARTELPAEYPAQATEILHVIAAHKAWAAAGGGGGLEPADVERLAGKGEVEFRIVVGMKDVDLPAFTAAVDELWKRGPGMPVKVGAGGVPAVWVVAGAGVPWSGDMAAAVSEGDLYLLCYDDQGHRLTHHDPKRDAWTLAAGEPFIGISGEGATLPFRLDAKGAGYMTDLTTRWKGQAMAIVWDDHVVCAPVIQSAIGDAGMITFGVPAEAHVSEAKALRRVVNAPALPTALKRIH